MQKSTPLVEQVNGCLITPAQLYNKHNWPKKPKQKAQAQVRVSQSQGGGGEKQRRCSYCGKDGHSVERCFKKIREDIGKGKFPDEIPDVKCRRCKKAGHLQFFCPDVKCHGCDKMGHMQYCCPNAENKPSQAMRKPTVQIRIVRDPRHLSMVCATKTGVAVGSVQIGQPATCDVSPQPTSCNVPTSNPFAALNEDDLWSGLNHCNGADEVIVANVTVNASTRKAKRKPRGQRQTSTTQSTVVPALGSTLSRLAARCDSKSGATLDVAVLVDSGSTANFLSSKVCRVVDTTAELQVAGAGGDFVVDAVGFVDLVDSEGHSVKVYGYRHELPANCDVLLGNHAISQLGLSQVEPTPMDCGIDQLPRLNFGQGVLHSVGEQLHENVEVVKAQAFWSEARMEQYLRESPAVKQPLKQYTWRDVDVCPDLPESVKNDIGGVLKRHSAVFETNSIPNYNKVYEREEGAVDIVGHLKPGYKPFHCPSPSYGRYHCQYLDVWRQEMEEAGVIFPNPTSKWAMRLTVAENKGEPRVCFDVRALNAQMEPIGFEIPNGVEMLMRVSVVMRRIGVDLIKAYFQYPLTVASQECVTFWVPVAKGSGFEMRKYSSRVMIFGWNWAPAVLAKHMQSAFDLLQPETQKFTATFYDDAASGAEDSPANGQQPLLRALEDILGVFEKKGMLLKAPKCAVGYMTGTFYGFTLNADGSNTLSDKFLAGLDNIAVPTNVTEVRSLMGSLNVARDMVPDFSSLARPITSLTKGAGKKTDPVPWPDECVVALDELLKRIRSAVRRYKPDFRYPLYLATDASDAGCGGHLHQRIPLDSVAGGGGGTDVPQEYVIRTIGFFSKAWSEALRKRPIFYREAWSLLYFLAKTKLFARSSPYPVKVVSDHAPLVWVKSTHKGAVTSFLLDELADVQFEVEYKPGTSKEMCAADALSRYPMLGPKKWSTQGLESFFDLLNRQIGSTLGSASKVGVYAGVDTQKLVAKIRESYPEVKMVTTLASMAQEDVDLVVMAPTPDRAPGRCRELLKSGKPIACLVPTDLISRIPQQQDGEIDEAVQRLLDSSSFVGSASSMFLWVVSAVERVVDAIVATAVATAAARDLTTTPLENVTTVDVTAWIGKQPVLEDDEKGSVLKDANGLLYWWSTDGLPKIIVPEPERDELIKRVHADEVGHMRVPQTLHALRQRFFWPGTMRADVKRVLLKCEECSHVTGSRRLAHGNFRGLRYRGPRLQYQVDVKKAAGGYVLGVVDTFDGYAVLIPMHSRTTAAVVDALVNDVFLVYGFPLEVRTDNAKEFGPRLKETLLRWGVRSTDTKSHHATGNSHVERIWSVVKKFLKMQPTMVEWRRQLKLIAFVLNTTFKELYQLTPFEVQFGLPALSALRAGTVTALNGDSPATAREVDLIESLVRANIGQCRTAGNVYRRDQAAKARARGVKRGNKKPIEFAVGDLVMTFREATATKNLAFEKLKDFSPVWVGPWMVVERHGTAYTLQGMRDGPGVSKGETCERTVMNIKPYTGILATSKNREFEALAPEEEVISTLVQVTVPATWSGEPLEFELAGTTFLALPPDGSKVGDTFTATVPVEITSDSSVEETAVSEELDTDREVTDPTPPRRSARLSKKGKAE